MSRQRRLAMPAGRMHRVPCGPHAGRHGAAATPGGRARDFDSRMGLTINPLHLGWKAAQRRLVGARSIEDAILGIAARRGCPAGGRRHQPSLVPSQSRLSAPPREDASMSGRESAARRARHAGGPHAGHRGPHGSTARPPRPALPAGGGGRWQGAVGVRSSASAYTCAKNDKNRGNQPPCPLRR